MKGESDISKDARSSRLEYIFISFSHPDAFAVQVYPLFDL